jgi:hypothetical protein
MNSQQIYLNEAHKAACEKALALQAKEQSMSYEECIEQTKKLASTSLRHSQPDSKSTAPYAPLKSGKLGAA